MATLLREVNSVSHETNWLGQRDDRIVFGLGDHGSPLRLEVRWPSGQVQVIEDAAEGELTSHLNAMTAPLVVTEPGGGDSGFHWPWTQLNRKEEVRRSRAATEAMIRTRRQRELTDRKSVV